METGECRVEVMDHGRLWASTRHLPLLELNHLTSFSAFATHPGHGIAKSALAERSTIRLDLSTPSGEVNPFFLKRHTVLTWPRAVWVWLRLRHPPATAQAEWEALWAFRLLNIPAPVPVAFGREGRRSFVLTEGVRYSLRLSQWAERYREGPKDAAQVLRKRRLIQEVARIVGRMHAAGLCHQDLYLCHFLCGSEPSGLPLTLIDLQRVGRHPRLSRRWLVKDLAQLYFSASAFLTRQDLLRFWRAYSAEHTVRAETSSLLRSIVRKSDRIRRHTLKHHL